MVIKSSLTMLVVCLALAGCGSDDDPATDELNTNDTAQTDDGDTGDGGTTDTDNDSGDGDSADNDTSDTDDGGQVDSDDTTDSDDNTDVVDSDDTTDSDDGDSVDGGDGTDDAEPSVAVAQFEWSDPVLMYDGDAVPMISAFENQVVVTWLQDSEMWALVGTEGDLENAQQYNVSRSGRAYYWYDNTVGAEYAYKPPRPIATNAEGVTCIAWRQGLSVRGLMVSCYLPTEFAWSEPLTIYDSDVYQFELAALSNGTFALAYHYRYGDRKHSMEVGIFTPGELKQTVVVEDEKEFSQFTVAPDDSGGVNLLYSGIRPPNDFTHILTLANIDSGFNVTKTVLDDRYTHKRQLMLVSGDNPAVAYVHDGDVNEIIVLDETLSKVSLGDVRLKPYRHHTFKRTSNGDLHMAWESAAGDAVIEQLHIRDGVAEYSSTPIWDPNPQLLVNDDELYMYHSNGTFELAGEIYFRHYYDGAWSESYRLHCPSEEECRSRADNIYYAITDDIIAIVYIGNPGVYVMTTAKDEMQ